MASRLNKRSGEHRSKPTEPSSDHTLEEIRAGQRVKVARIAAGQAATLQLAQLGIRSGATLVVRRSAPLGGPVMVESGGSMVAIGRGMARKVVVWKLE